MFTNTELYLAYRHSFRFPDFHIGVVVVNYSTGTAHTAEMHMQSHGFLSA